MNDLAQRPVVLDIDRSVGPLPDRLVLPLEHWQESIRFGCSLATMRRFRAMLDELLPAEYGTVFMGSGDFHHLSWPLIARLQPRAPFQASTPFQVVVLDNHPDNMRFPFGVHCGSWVRRVAMLPMVSHVHVLGITSADIGAGHAWENYLTPLLRGKLTYWNIGVDTSWARRLGLARAFRGFDTPAAMVDAFVEALATRIAKFDKWAIGQTKRLVNASLPPDVELGAGWDACIASLGRTAAQDGIKALIARGFHKPGDAENRLGYYLSQIPR